VGQAEDVRPEAGSWGGGGAARQPRPVPAHHGVVQAVPPGSLGAGEC